MQFKKSSLSSLFILVQAHAYSRLPIRTKFAKYSKISMENKQNIQREKCLKIEDRVLLKRSA